MTQYIIVNEAHGPYEALGSLLLEKCEDKRAREYLSMYYIVGEETHTYPTIESAIEECEEMREEFSNDQLVVYACERVGEEEYNRILSEMT